MLSICLFGDGIGEGFFDSKKGGWVSRLSRTFEAPNEELTIYNCSVSGDSTREVLKRFKVESGAREPDIIIFALGVNDSWYFNNKKSQPNVSLEEFKKNIESLISKAHEMDANVTFIGPCNIDESKSMPVEWRPEVYYDNENIKKYNAEIKNICKKHNIKFIETFDLLKQDDFSDGLHPNSKGHKKIFDKILKEINLT